MERLKDALSFPMRLAGAFVRIGGRITVGSVGFLLMGAGLLIQLAVVVFLFGLISEQIASGQERR